MGGQVTIPLVLVLLVFWKSVNAFIFADQSCVAKYQCPSRPGLHCIASRPVGTCPYYPRDTEGMIPSDPKKVHITKSSFRESKTSKCVTRFHFSWIPPNDQGGMALKGFELFVWMQQGGLVNMRSCMAFNLSGTLWTQPFLEEEIPFTYDCFITEHPGTYVLGLRSLPGAKFDLTPSSHMTTKVIVTAHECEPAPTTGLPFDPATDRTLESVPSYFWTVSAIVGTVAGLLLILAAVFLCRSARNKPRPGVAGGGVASGVDENVAVTVDNNGHSRRSSFPRSVSEVFSWVVPESFRASGPIDGSIRTGDLELNGQTIGEYVRISNLDYDYMSPSLPSNGVHAPIYESEDVPT